MKTLLVLTLVVCALAATALPTAHAANKCTILNPGCPGIYCEHNGWYWQCVGPGGYCDPHACPDPRDLLPEKIPPLLP